jgi:putative hemolysin
MESVLGFVLIVLLCLGFSFLLSGMESGLFSLSRLRIRQQMRSGKYSARLLHGYLENPENFLWTILIGNTVATFVAYSLIIVALYDSFASQPLLFLLCFVWLAFLFYVLCDLLPKMLFRLFPNRFCLWMALPFRFIHFGLSPLVALLSWFSSGLLSLTGGRNFSGQVFASRSEFRLMMTHESSQALTSDERIMINRVLDLQNITLRSITIPMERVVGASPNTTAAELLELCRKHRSTRIPIWQLQAGGRRIIGFVSINSLLYGRTVDLSTPASEFLKPALYLREDVRLEEALRRMQRAGHRLAVVVGLDQHEVGVVSVQDILKSIFGEVSL